MRNHLKPVLLSIGLFISFNVFCQTVTISGNVKSNVNKDVVPEVSVTVKGSKVGTFTNDKGNFRLTTTSPLPLTLVFSSIGYETQEVVVSNASDVVHIDFKPAFSLGAEVVVSASRVPQRILESPVTIQRIGSAAIRNTPQAQYYDALRGLTGVDVTTSGLIFTSITTRGFNGSGNPRFNQFVDGMDNQAPGLNFSVASIVGLTELDVDNMELLSGASSALYGSGGMNGTLLMTSKDPFKYQGVSFQVKEGVMHLSGGDGKSDPQKPSPYNDYTVRWGQKLSDKFAFKINAQFIEAKDWVANDQSDYTQTFGTGSANHTIAGTRASDPNYNGVNVYGDETFANMNSVANSVQTQTNNGILAATGGQLDVVSQLNGFLTAYYPTTPPTQAQLGAFLTGLAGSLTPAQQAALIPAVQNLLPFAVGLHYGVIPNQNVSRTGFPESQIINNNTVSFKASGGVYYKITPNTEASITGNWGTGNTVYTGADRYSLKDFKMGQYKFEIKSEKWFFRFYTTQENAGKTFDATVTTRLFNEAWKASTTWFPEYTGAYVGAISQGASSAAAHQAARAYADQGMPTPGSAQFKAMFDSVASRPLSSGGGLLLDRSNLYHTEGQYNLSDIVKVVDVLVGASWRQYVLNSQGTIFADTTGPIHTNEYGAYVQVSKRLFDILRLTASGRYDKNDNFQGKFTPRVSAVLTVAPDQNIRASYQSAYRFPSNQNQWINLNTGEGILIGGLPQLRNFYNFTGNPVFNAATFQPQTFGTFKPESVNAYELGYKGLFGKRFLIDAYGYYSQYHDFIGRVQVVQSTSGNPATINPADPTSYQGYSVSTNSANKVSTYGWGLSADYLLDGNYAIGVNISSDNIHNPDSTFATYFNTPKYRFNITFSNSGFGPQKRYGFNVDYRWQDKYYTEADFVQGPVSAFGTFDAQVSYKLSGIRSLIKIGGCNILNHYYTSQFGNPAIGGMYYISFGYNVF
jgi:outer membrane receptor protein involved in Fe transport